MFVTVKKLVLVSSQLTLSGIQRLCNSLNIEPCLELKLSLSDFTDEYIDVIKKLVERKLSKLSLEKIKITHTGVDSLCEALQHPRCKLTTLSLEKTKITHTSVASLCEALQHPSCKLTTINLEDNDITDTGVASLCKALQHPSCQVTTLNLKDNDITETGAASLCNCFTASKL